VSAAKIVTMSLPTRGVTDEAGQQDSPETPTTRPLCRSDARDPLAADRDVELQQLAGEHR
jgi:hypothetical protein